MHIIGTKGCFVFGIIMMVFISGCAGVQTRVITVQRIDQEIYGNGGYVTGKCPPRDEESNKIKTRQVLEVDVTKYTDGK